MNDIESKVRDLLGNVIEGLGYELYDVEYINENNEWYLRIYIDKESGISINDCENVSNSISDMLDEADYIKEQYFLEVSSSGERKEQKSKEK